MEKAKEWKQINFSEEKFPRTYMMFMWLLLQIDVVYDRWILICKMSL